MLSPGSRLGEAKYLAGATAKPAAMIIFALVSLLSMLVPRSSTPAALSEFAHAWSKIQAYKAVLAMHETSGPNVQDRTYDYAFRKPQTASIAITSGPGKGGRETWEGGATVVASPPGLLSHMKLRLSMKDARVATLRGDTIEMASFGWLLQHLQSKGKLSQSSGPVIEKKPTKQLELIVADPASNGGVTREVVDLSITSDLPVRVLRYADRALVKQIDFKDVRIRP